MPRAFELASRESATHNRARDSKKSDGLVRSGDRRDPQEIFRFVKSNQARYRITTLCHTLGVFFEFARTVLSRDGYHRTITIIWGSKNARVIDNSAQDKADKFLLWRRAADKVRESRATRVIVVGEVWSARVDVHSSVTDIAQLENKQEGLSLVAASIEGETVDLYAPISRSENRDIVLGPTEERRGVVPGFLAPIFDVWTEMRRENES